MEAFCQKYVTYQTLQRLYYVISILGRPNMKMDVLKQRSAASRDICILRLRAIPTSQKFSRKKNKYRPGQPI